MCRPSPISETGTIGVSGAESDSATTLPSAAMTCTARMRSSVRSTCGSICATPSVSTSAATSFTRAAALLSIPDNIDRYSTATRPAPAKVSVKNTTVAATNAERAEIPQFHGRHHARLAPAIGVQSTTAVRFAPYRRAERSPRPQSRTMLPVSDIRQVHEWFLHRGLPLVLTRRVRSRALIERSAPMVSGVGAVISLTMMLAELTDGDPDFGYVTRLGVLTLLLIAAPFALYLLHQSGTTLGEAGRRSTALIVMALFVFGLP